LLRKGDELFRQGGHEEALECFDKALKIEDFGA
jgi:hypothetical protein